MHPLLARIHPAVRTGLFAWLISRAALWLTTRSRPDHLASGNPVPGLVETGLDYVGAATDSALAEALLSVLPWLTVEIAVLFAGIAVYRFARTTGLPRLAERACWMWFFNPVLAMTALDWGAQIAASAGAVALAGIVTHRPRRAIAAAVVAVGCRLEFVVLWPALAMAAWRRYDPKRGTPLTLGASIAVLPVAFSAWLGLSWHLAGSAHTSIRALHGEASWRTADRLLVVSFEDLLLSLGLVTAAVLAVRFVRRFPIWYLVGALPLLAWPLLQVPVHFAAVTTAWSLPTFVHLAAATDDRGVERPLLAALIVAFVLAAGL